MSEPKAGARIYQRSPARGGGWVAAADTAEVHTFAVVATERLATTAARYLGQMAEALREQVPEGGMERGEFADGRPTLREKL